MVIQVSVGTLLAFTTVAVSVLIIRYVPPNEVPIPSSLLTCVDPLLNQSSGDIEEETTMSPVDLASYFDNSHLHDKPDVRLEHPLIIKEVAKGNCCLNLGYQMFKLVRQKHIIENNSHIFQCCVITIQ